MRRLLPTPRDEPLDALYLDLRFPERPDRPYTYLHFVMSADGGATLRGRTKGLGGEADRLAFLRLRETCDVILVGAGTVRTERYGPPRLDPEAQARRRARGLAPLPRIAIVTSRLLDPALRVFSDPEQRPLVIAPEDADPQGIARVAEVAELLPCGRGQVDLRRMLALFRARGVRWILCEGGPTLAAQLVAQDLVDEFFLTLAPRLVGPIERRLLAESIGPVRNLHLLELREHRGDLLLRYALVPGGEEPQDP
jgi:riboflavin-specific deaminase-like protein